MKEFLTLRSGAKIPRIKKKDVDSQKYITRSVLMQMHLSPATSGINTPTSADRTLAFVPL